MSKIIEPAPFLSEFDRQYLIDRGLDPADYLIDEDVSDPTDDVPPYEEWEVPALQREIAERNADRDEDSQIVPDGTGKDGRLKKSDLVRALDADDEATSGDTNEDDA